MYHHYQTKSISNYFIHLLAWSSVLYTSAAVHKSLSFFLLVPAGCVAAIHSVVFNSFFLLVPTGRLAAMYSYRTLLSSIFLLVPAGLYANAPYVVFILRCIRVHSALRNSGLFICMCISLAWALYYGMFVCAVATCRFLASFTFAFCFQCSFPFDHCMYFHFSTMYF